MECSRELCSVRECLSSLRTLAQLMVMLGGCFAACWMLTLAGRGIISGQVIDWKTGQPAPYVDVLSRGLNSSEVVTRTGADGRFRFRPKHSRGVYFLFVGAPRYGTLLQATVGQTIVMYRKSDVFRNVVIPGIPATELSGHVYGSDGRPISGCSVSAITRASHFDPSNDLQVQGARSILPYDLAEADDPNKLLWRGAVRTNAQGMYAFHDLGADRYFVLARCKGTQAQGPVSYSWVPTLFPGAASLISAQQILLLPGDRRTNIDFHMLRARAYSLDGTVAFSDLSKPKPWPEAIYLQDLIVFRSDRGVTSTSLGEESCQMDANRGTFRCDSLLPGEYTFYFQVSAGLGAASDLPTQAATVRYRVPAANTQHLKVQLHNVSGHRVVYQRPFEGAGGVVDFVKVCDAASGENAAIRALASGPGYAGLACYFTRFGASSSIRLPQGDYNVIAFEASILHRPFGRGSKFEEALVQHGTRIRVEIGQTEKPSLPVLTTAQMIDIGLSALRVEPRKFSK